MGSLGQPLWFVLMLWFQNPNILRTVICSFFFPFYSVILLLFFFFLKLSKAINREKRSGFKWETQDKGDKKRTPGGWKVKIKCKRHSLYQAVFRLFSVHCCTDPFFFFKQGCHQEMLNQPHSWEDAHFIPCMVYNSGKTWQKYTEAKRSRSYARSACVLVTRETFFFGFVKLCLLFPGYRLITSA